MLNDVKLMGRLTATPELKTTMSGVSVTNFSLAVERDYKNKETGERVTDFFDCVAYRSTAEFMTRYFSKGRMAVVCGSIQTRKYTDKDGNNRRAVEIQVDKAYFADSNNGGTGTTDAGQPTAYAQPAYTQPAPNYEELNDDEELPF